MNQPIKHSKLRGTTQDYNLGGATRPYVPRFDSVLGMFTLRTVVSIFTDSGNEDEPPVFVGEYDMLHIPEKFEPMFCRHIAARGVNHIAVILYKAVV